MVEGQLEQMKLQKRLIAAHATIVIKGSREKKPRLQAMIRTLLGEDKVAMSDTMREALSESHARVARENPDVREKQMAERFQADHAEEAALAD